MSIRNPHGRKFLCHENKVYCEKGWKAARRATGKKPSDEVTFAGELTDAYSVAFSVTSGALYSNNKKFRQEYLSWLKNIYLKTPNADLSILLHIFLRIRKKYRKYPQRWRKLSLAIETILKFMEMEKL